MSVSQKYEESHDKKLLKQIKHVNLIIWEEEFGGKKIFTSYEGNLINKRLFRRQVDPICKEIGNTLEKLSYLVFWIYS